MKLTVIHINGRNVSIFSFYLVLIAVVWNPSLDTKYAYAIQWVDRTPVSHLSYPFRSSASAKGNEAGVYFNSQHAISHRRQYPVAHIQNTQVVSTGNYDVRTSRVALLLSERGLQALSISNVLLVGASNLALEIATHLIRSGIRQLSIWHNSLPEVRNMLNKLRVMHQDAAIDLLEREPDYDKDLPDAVVFVDQPFKAAIEVNAKVRSASKFVYAKSAGVYGIVLSDFGNSHQVLSTSDKEHSEHQGTVKSFGAQSVIEITVIDDIDTYKSGDLVCISLPAYLVPNGSGKCISDTIVEKFKVLEVDAAEDGTVRLKVDVDLRDWEKTAFTVRKVVPHVNFNFESLGSLTRRLLERVPFIVRFMEKLKKPRKGPERLIIAPANNSRLNDNTISLLAALLELGQPSTKEDPQKNATFNVLKNVDIPAVTTLIGSLAAQEVVKGLSGMFTPSDLIIVDRSDIYPDNGNYISPEEAHNHVRKPGNYEYLLVGAGALGCEFLKMFASMNVTNVTVVDNDTVDISNLTRQTLFRASDVGSNKASSALNNLRLLTQLGLKKYVARQELFTEAFSWEPAQAEKPIVVVSAVDNLNARLILDNFAVENSHVFVEAGIHGMQCSTFISLPHITESYGSTIGSEMSIGNKNSCSVKGIPRTTEDTVFYAKELFVWLFHKQHELFNEFIKDPLVTLREALERDEKLFPSVLRSLVENCKVGLSTEYARTWAKKTYDTYFKIHFPLKEMLLDSLAAIKARAVHSSVSEETKNPSALQHLVDEVKLLLKKHFEHKSGLSKRDVYIESCKLVEEIFNEPALVQLLNNKSKEMKPLSFNDSLAADLNFLYAASNTRAYKFGIRQSDMATIVKTAKSIIPAISTTVGIAASMAILELYKTAPLLARFNRCKRPNDAEGKSEKHTPGDITLTTAGRTEKSIWCILDRNEAKCLNKTDVMATLNISDVDQRPKVADALTTHFFNLSVMKYFTKRCDPPELFKVANKDALLKGSSFSLWDHIIVRDVPPKKAYIGPKETAMEEFSYITIGDVVDVVRILFAAKVESLHSLGQYIQVTENNLAKTLKETFPTASTRTIYIVGKDKDLMEDIGLPILRYIV